MKKSDRSRGKKKPLSPSDAMRRTMRQWASGVTIVATKYRRERSGMTVSAFISGTIDPPTVMVCLNSSSSTFRMIRKSRKLAISVLSDKQRVASNLFAGANPAIKGDDRFRNLRTFTAKTGSPILSGSAAWLDCKVIKLVKLSTHHMAVCQVVAAGRNSRAGRPLLYYDRGYRKVRK